MARLRQGRLQQHKQFKDQNLEWFTVGVVEPRILPPTRSASNVAQNCNEMGNRGSDREVLPPAELVERLLTTYENEVKKGKA